LTADELHNPALPHLSALARQGCIGLMNTAVAGPKTDTAAVLTLALGALAPAEPTDEEAFNSHTEWVEGAPAGIVFQRRTGIDGMQQARRGESLVHLGIASLHRRGLNQRLVGAVLAHAGKRGVLRLCGNADAAKPGRRAALFVVDSEGIGPPMGGLASISSGDSPEELGACVRRATNALGIVVHLGDGMRAEMARSRLSAEAYMQARNAALAKLDRFIALLPGAVEDMQATRILLVSPRPPVNARGEWEDRLTPIVVAGAGITPGLLTSATTRTHGLVANIDIAPTLLQWLHVPTPPSIAGHPMTFAKSLNPLASVLRLDQQVTVGAQAMVPLFLSMGGLALLIGFGGLAILHIRPAWGALCAFGILFLMNMPLSTLLIVPCHPTSVGWLILGTYGLMLAGAIIETALATLLGRKLKIPHAPAKILLLAFFTVFVLLIDAFRGQPWVKMSVFSSYPLQGFRFYGIGNEYMSVLIGATLLLVTFSHMPRLWAVVWMVGVAFVIGFPRLGANAGGLVAAAVAFGSAGAVLWGRRPSWYGAVWWALVGFSVAFAWAYVDLLLPGGAATASHLGSALQNAGAQGWEYLMGIVMRKLWMNARILIHPFMLIALFSIGAVVLLAHGLMHTRVKKLSARHPGWASGLPVTVYGALAAFLFNDSGIVAAAFLLGAFILAGFYLLFAEWLTDSSTRLIMKIP